MEYKVGDIVELRKPHTCGGKIWEIVRTGVDFKFKCCKCEHIIMINRQKALKMIKNK
jgi:hypothetical protein